MVSKLSKALDVDHNDLGSLQGGITDQYYHLTASAASQAELLNVERHITTGDYTLTTSNKKIQSFYLDADRSVLAPVQTTGSSWYFTIIHSGPLGYNLTVKNASGTAFSPVLTSGSSMSLVYDGTLLTSF